MCTAPNGVAKYDDDVSVWESKLAPSCASKPVLAHMTLQQYASTDLTLPSASTLPYASIDATLTQHHLPMR